MLFNGSRGGFLSFKIIFTFWQQRIARGILVPQPGIKPVPHALDVWSFNHWTARGSRVLCERVCVCGGAKLLQSCPALCNPMD